MRWISLFRQVPKVRPDGQVPKEIQESGGPRGKRESLGARHSRTQGEPGPTGPRTKAFRGEVPRVHKGEMGPTGPRGEIKGRTWCAGASGRLVHGSARHPRRGRLTWGDGPTGLGEKRENLVRRGFREKLVLRVRKASKERSAYKEMGPDRASGRKGRACVQGLRRSLGPTGPQGIQGEAVLGRGDGADRPSGEKRENLVCRGFREKLVPLVRKASKEAGLGYRGDGA